MHYLKKQHNSHKDINIALYPSSELENISINEWKDLQKKSFYNNPFFEHWNLIPAIRNLSTQKKPIIVVALYKNESMVGLFPIIKTYRFKTIPICSIWLHNHCFLSTPLISIDVDFDKLMINLSNHLNCYWSCIPFHDQRLITSSTKNNIFSFPYNRAAIHDTNSINQHIEQFKGKRKRELYREIKRLKSLGDINLIKYKSIKNGLSDFSELEFNGWKGKGAGAILSDPDVSKYYQEAFNDNGDKIDIFGLFSNNELIACTIRLKSKDKYYEIKTTYDERMRKFAPGKIMELYLLEELSSHVQAHVDSCTNQDNKFINWLWPDEIQLNTTYIFQRNLISKLFNIIYLLKQWIRKKYLHA